MNKKRQEVLREAASNYRQSLQKSLQSRLERAREQGNERLIRQLEAEASYLKLN